MDVARLWKSMAGSVLPARGGHCRNPPPKSACARCVGTGQAAATGRRSASGAIRPAPAPAARRFVHDDAATDRIFPTPSGPMLEVGTCERRSAPPSIGGYAGAGGSHPGSCWPPTAISLAPKHDNGWPPKRRILRCPRSSRVRCPRCDNFPQNNDLHPLPNALSEECGKQRFNSVMSRPSWPERSNQNTRPGKSSKHSSAGLWMALAQPSGLLR